jgi:hypothetical protein
MKFGLGLGLGLRLRPGAEIGWTWSCRSRSTWKESYCLWGLEAEAAQLMSEVGPC